MISYYTGVGNNNCHLNCHCEGEVWEVWEDGDAIAIIVMQQVRSIF